MDDHPARSFKAVAVVVAVVLLAAGGAVAWSALRTSRSDMGADPPASDRRPPIRNIVPPETEPSPLVDPDMIVSGGPPPDGIPPIDHPKFQPVSEVDWLADKEPVIALEISGDARAYPLQILTWHEIVNDEVGGVPVTVTFCPLCNTAFAYERPNVNGEITTFGTSGNLYLSNLVMYDRATESYWPQALGQAVTGPLTGTKLARRPAQMAAWKDFRDAFPGGQVLSRATGFERSYGENPYPGYDEIGTPPFAFFGIDDRLDAVDRVLGVETRAEVVTFPYFQLRHAASGPVAAVNADVGGKPVLVVWKAGAVSALDAIQIAESRKVGAAFAFSRKLDRRVLTFAVDDGEIVDSATHSTWNFFGRATAGRFEGRRLRPADAHDSYWFDWAAFHPNTTIWPGE